VLLVDETGKLNLLLLNSQIQPSEGRSIARQSFMKYEGEPRPALVAEDKMDVGLWGSNIDRYTPPRPGDPRLS
jgi:hypothetical protein